MVRYWTSLPPPRANTEISQSENSQIGEVSAPVNSPQPVGGSGTASTVNQPSQPAAPVNGTDLLKIQSETSTFFILSIVATVMCCWAAGIPAIIFSSKARRCVNMQDFTGAQEALKNAKLWTFVAIGVGAVVGIFAFFIFLLGMM